MLATIIAEAGDVVNSTSPALLIFAGLGMLSNVAFWMRWEHRMTKVETKLDNLPCGNCEPRRPKHSGYRIHPGLKVRE